MKVFVISPTKSTAMTRSVTSIRNGVRACRSQGQECERPQCRSEWGNAYGRNSPIGPTLLGGQLRELASRTKDLSTKARET